MKTIQEVPVEHQPTLAATTLADLRARRQTIHEELLQAPEWKKGSTWHTDRMHERCALTRQIVAMKAGGPVATAADRRRVMEQLRRRREEAETQMERSGYREWQEPNDLLRLERDAIQARLEALEALGDGGPRLAVTLDDYGSTIVRRLLKQYPEATPADLANGALSFMAGEEDDHDMDPEIEKASARRIEKCKAPVPAPGEPAGHEVTIHLSPTQLRMFMQIADDDGTGSMAEVVLRELGQHVALHLECYHNHRLEDALARWDREAKEVA